MFLYRDARAMVRQSGRIWGRADQRNLKAKWVWGTPRGRFLRKLLSDWFKMLQGSSFWGQTKTYLEDPHEEHFRVYVEDPHEKHFRVYVEDPHEKHFRVTEAFLCKYLNYYYYLIEKKSQLLIVNLIYQRVQSISWINFLVVGNYCFRTTFLLPCPVTLARKWQKGRPPPAPSLSNVPVLAVYCLLLHSFSLLASRASHILKYSLVCVDLQTCSCDTN